MLFLIQLVTHTMVLVVMEPRCARCDPSPNHWVTAAAAAAGLNLVTALMTTAQ